MLITKVDKDVRLVTTRPLECYLIDTSGQLDVYPERAFLLPAGTEVVFNLSFNYRGSHRAIFTVGPKEWQAQAFWSIFKDSVK